MDIQPLHIDGAWLVTPRQHPDDRGVFLEWFRQDRLAAAAGRRLELAQANVSVSRRGVVRGIHYTDVPPGQAKYVCCLRGAVWDVVVDLRQGSPTFGAWQGVRLDDSERRAVFLSEGLGHGICALTDDATVAYFCSTSYNPAVERSVHPLDPALGITWPVTQPVLSARDANAPALSEALLPRLS